MRAHAMRNLIPALLCLLAVACGGDFSNDDLEFQNALPQREDLAAMLPDSARRAGQGTGTREDRLGLQVPGATSELAVQSYQVGTQFNASVDALLTLLELFRGVAPTTRETDRRIWGPFPADDHPGHELRLVMERQGGDFAYRLQFRPRGAGEDGWWTYLPGTFKADGGIRKGTGTLALDLKEARANGFDTREADGLDRLDIRYQTKALPTSVELLFTGAGATLPLTRYASRQVPEGLGEMTFRLPGQDLVPGGLLETLDIVSRWTPEGRGKLVLTILEGDAKGLKYTECWDAQTRITFLQRNWDFINPTEGSAASCPDVSALGP
ncbi:hypothetical protein D7Y13_16605 [Corallococcus praedator]|uniref:Lipoprotein n=2 Tax=Myxococcaceae TaxID=31 RepID=A0ABX9QHG0_9BACT|nr:hypothetical protein D7X74_02625 [Corallococcus sp. CA047B]RKH36340.1 hypothetical protein D7X75_00760 [Corallococcus sp. CA031C]RKI08139.1 hypothetical protein D7Y13_16605 [Corallococcus praedator]